ncbi:hypothetical protein JCM10212_006507 [Sporobolomyces blumeae]
MPRPVSQSQQQQKTTDPRRRPGSSASTPLGSVASASTTSSGTPLGSAKDARSQSGPYSSYLARTRFHRDQLDKADRIESSGGSPSARGPSSAGRKSEHAEPHDEGLTSAESSVAGRYRTKLADLPRCDQHINPQITEIKCLAADPWATGEHDDLASDDDSDEFDRLDNVKADAAAYDKFDASDDDDAW